MFVLLLWNVFLKSVQWRSETSDTPSVSEDKNIWWIKSKSTVVETSCVFSEFVSLSGCDDKWWLIDGPSGEEWSVLWSDSKKVTSLIPSSYCRSLFFFLIHWWQWFHLRSLKNPFPYNMKVNSLIPKCVSFSVFIVVFVGVVLSSDSSVNSSDHGVTSHSLLCCHKLHCTHASLCMLIR